jgi:hypothetical protein
MIVVSSQTHQKFSSNGLDLAELEPKKVDNPPIPTDPVNLDPAEIRAFLKRILRNRGPRKRKKTQPAGEAAPQLPAQLVFK